MARVGAVNIVFVEPGFPANQRRFALALASVGANVIGIGESDEYSLDETQEAFEGSRTAGGKTWIRVAGSGLGSGLG